MLIGPLLYAWAPPILSAGNTGVDKTESLSPRAHILVAGDEQPTHKYMNFSGDEKFKEEK